LREIFIREKEEIESQNANEVMLARQNGADKDPQGDAARDVTIAKSKHATLVSSNEQQRSKPTDNASSSFDEHAGDRYCIQASSKSQTLGMSSTLDPRQLSASLSPPAVSRNLESRFARTASVTFEAKGIEINIEANEMFFEKFARSGTDASPQSRSPPPMPPKSSPSMPHSLRHSSSATCSKEPRSGFELSEASPGYLNSTLSGARMRGISTRSLSPLPVVTQTRSGFTSEPPRSFQPSEVEESRHAWSTTSRSPGPPNLISRPNDNELHMLDKDSSRQAVAPRVGSNLADLVGSCVQATMTQKFDASVGKPKTPWR